MKLVSMGFKFATKNEFADLCHTGNKRHRTYYAATNSKVLKAIEKLRS